MKNLVRRDFLKLGGAAAAIGMSSLNPSKGLKASLLPFSSNPVQSGNSAEPWLDISLENIGWNLDRIRNLVKNLPVMAVIKANGYGHGVVEMGKYLEKRNTRFLAVGKFQEAFDLRENGVKTPVLNFGSFSGEEAEELVKNNISQSVYTDDYIMLAESARRLDTTAKVHIKVDTGLGRIGVHYRDALQFIEKVAETRGITIEGIFTPFTEDDEYDREQLKRFLEVCESAAGKGIPVGIRHAASSAGILSFPDGYLDMVRPGIMIYGEYPSLKEYEARKVDLRPAMSLKTRVMYVKTLRPGESISYHRNYVAEKETKVATLSIGYSDGYPYQVAGKADALIHGRRWKSIALITSNHMTVDITGAENIKVGDEAVLFGKQGNGEISAEEVAAWADTSVYKILIWMNPLLKRNFV